jgi:hypothetical protein
MIECWNKRPEVKDNIPLERQTVKMREEGEVRDGEGVAARVGGDQRIPIGAKFEENAEKQMQQGLIETLNIKGEYQGLEMCEGRFNTGFSDPVSGNGDGQQRTLIEPPKLGCSRGDGYDGGQRRLQCMSDSIQRPQETPASISGSSEITEGYSDFRNQDMQPRSQDGHGRMGEEQIHELLEGDFEGNTIIDPKQRVDSQTIGLEPHQKQNDSPRCDNNKNYLAYLQSLLRKLPTYLSTPLSFYPRTESIRICVKPLRREVVDQTITVFEAVSTQSILKHLITLTLI